MIQVPSDLNDAPINEAADYYFYKFGVNLTWVNTRNKKKTTEKWKPLQDSPLLEQQHKVWRDEKYYENNGIGLVMGKFWNNPLMEGMYLNCIDFDNKAGIDAWCAKHGIKSLQELATRFPVEQHSDDLNRAHIYIITRDRPLRNKGRNASGNQNNIPSIEVLGKGRYVCSTPSIHENGYKYRYPYGLKPIEEYQVFNAAEIENIVNDICIEHGVPYLKKNKNDKVNGNDSTVSVQTVEEDGDDNKKWYKGERNYKLHRWACSKYVKLGKDTHPDDIKALVYAKDRRKCEPTLYSEDPFEVERICKSAKSWADEVIAKGHL